MNNTRREFLGLGIGLCIPGSLLALDNINKINYLYYRGVKVGIINRIISREVKYDYIATTIKVNVFKETPLISTYIKSKTSPCILVGLSGELVLQEFKYDDSKIISYQVEKEDKATIDYSYEKTRIIGFDVSDVLNGTNIIKDGEIIGTWEKIERRTDNRRIFGRQLINYSLSGDELVTGIANIKKKGILTPMYNDNKITHYIWVIGKLRLNVEYRNNICLENYYSEKALQLRDVYYMGEMKYEELKVLHSTNNVFSDNYIRR